MPARHSACHPDQDSDPDGDRERDQRTVLDLARHPVQRAIANLAAEFGGLVAKAHRLVSGQAPAAAKTLDDVADGRRDGVANLISGGGKAGRSAAAGLSADALDLIFKRAQTALESREIGLECG